jgi:hypothetical protein
MKDLGKREATFTRVVDQPEHMRKERDLRSKSEAIKNCSNEKAKKINIK